MKITQNDLMKLVDQETTKILEEGFFDRGDNRFQQAVGGDGQPLFVNGLVGGQKAQITNTNN